MFRRDSRVVAYLFSLLGLATQRHYDTALGAFGRWCQQRVVPWAQLGEEERDWFLSEYLLDLKEEEGSTLQLGRYTLAAVQKTNARHRYTIGWKIITAWAKETPVVQAPPMPESLAMALAVLFVGAGMSEPRLRSSLCGAGVAVLLCFCGLMRIGEALAVTVGNVAISGCQMVLTLPTSKTGLARRVIIDNPRVVKFISYYLKMFPHDPRRRVVGINYAFFVKWFGKLLSQLHADHYNFRSHSLRRGGATALFMKGVDLRSIMVIGGWSSESSCRLYIRAGEAALISMANRADPRGALLTQALSQIGEHVFAVAL